MTRVLEFSLRVLRRNLRALRVNPRAQRLSLRAKGDKLLPGHAQLDHHALIAFVVDEEMTM